MWAHTHNCRNSNTWYLVDTVHLVVKSLIPVTVMHAWCLADTEHIVVKLLTHVTVIHTLYFADTAHIVVKLLTPVTVIHTWYLANFLQIVVKLLKLVIDIYSRHFAETVQEVVKFFTPLSRLQLPYYLADAAHLRSNVSHLQFWYTPVTPLKLNFLWSNSQLLSK